MHGLTLNFDKTEMLFFLGTHGHAVFSPLGQTISKIEIKKAKKLNGCFLLTTENWDGN